ADWSDQRGRRGGYDGRHAQRGGHSAPEHPRQAAGGEWGGAALMSVEHAPVNKRGLFGAYPQIGVPIGMLMATLFMFFLTTTLTPEQFETWGWRVPFLLGLLIGPVGFYIRARVDETPVFTDSHTQKSESPLRDALRDHPRGIASGFGVTILWTVCT
ncbi:MFS transporter, partial [Mycobacterium tuberculosis]|nr:MFS transporter [Mycobacterium tuberculosis]